MNKQGNVASGLVLLAGVACMLVWLFGAARATQGTAATAIPQPTPTVQAEPVNVFGGYRFADEQMLVYLRDRYQLRPIFQKIGTFDMAEKWTPEIDCIFPSSKTGIDAFESRRPGIIRRSETIFQDALVVFTWQEYVPALEKAGLVVTTDGVHMLRMAPLLAAMQQDKRWADLGIEIAGYVNVESTDPVKSASGLMWLSLMASYLVPGEAPGGRAVTPDALADPALLPSIYQYWENQGLQVETTGKLFPKFVLTHAPMIVAYESNYTDWYRSLPTEQQAVGQRVVGLYPEVTISTAHTLASTSPRCDALLDAFTTDAQLQQLAWEVAGVRNNAGGIGGRPDSAPWIAATVPFMPEPKLAVTEAIKACLEDRTVCGPTARSSQP